MKITLKIWHKLALAITSIIVLVLVVAMVLSQNSFRMGFLDYLNKLEYQRIGMLEKQLIVDYKHSSNWGFLGEDYHSWMHYIRESMRPEKGRKYQPDYPRGQEPRRPPSPVDHFVYEDDRPKSGAPKRPRPPLGDFALREDNLDEEKGRRRRAHISLYSNEHSLIAGDVQVGSSHIERPISVNGIVVAYLYIQPFDKLSRDLDQGFVQQQSRSFMKIALIALCLSLVAAWGLAYYFRARINKLTDIAHELTSGNYGQHTQMTHADELGQLGRDLNYLGKTLEQNRTARRQWVADISHELRTPLAILRGELEALEDGIRPLNKQSIQSLIAEVKRLVKLVEDLYQLSLSDLGSLGYVKEAIGVKDFVDELVEHFQQRFNRESITMSISRNVDSSVMLLCDERRLFQLFSNLFENSARYTDGGGQLQIHCSATKKVITIKIEDSSPSVPSEQLPYLFDRLYRAEGSRNSESGGAGLGLSIVKAITEAHNGIITASHSSLGGLAIILELPSHGR